jgi:pimeloyl-ACP methyl ester carboxylesterase
MIARALRHAAALAAVALPLLVAPLSGQTAAAAFDPATMDPPVRDSLHPARVEELEIPSAGSRMNALMYVAQGAGPHPTVVLLHGYPGNERNLDVAQAIRRAGANVLFFSYRGAWGSGGTFSFANAQADVAAALRFARSPAAAAKYGVDPTRVALVGHSMGGWLAFLGAAADRRVSCVGGIEVGDMARHGRDAGRNPRADSAFTAYTTWLAAPGAPLRADAKALVASLRQHAEDWSLPHVAPALAGRTVLLLDNTHNANHAELAGALERAGARLTADVWDTDHSFSDRRVALARTVVAWLHAGCGY